MLIWVTRKFSPCISLSQCLIILWPLTVNKNNPTINNLLIILLTQHRSASKERLKEVKGTRQTQTPPVYQKHHLQHSQYWRHCLPSDNCLTAAVSWPCKGSIIICSLNKDLYEWPHEGFTVSYFQSVKLTFPWRGGNAQIRREDPMEL